MYKKFPYPIIGDEKRKLAVSLQIIDRDEKDPDGRVVTARAVFIINSTKKIRLSILYPANTGRNFSEILRVIDSLQASDNPGVATTVDCIPKDNVMVQRTVSDKDIKFIYLTLIIFVLLLGKNLKKKTS